MRLVQITPGAGRNFYCENCLRDSALVVELKRLGHETLMVPLYLPILTDGPNPAEGVPIFFGGIQVYLQQRSRLFRKMPRWIGRLLNSRRLLTWAAKRAEMTDATDLGPPTLAMLRGEDGGQVSELERFLAWLSEHGRTDVVCLSNALLTGLARRIKEETGAPILCTLQDEDAFLDALPEPYRTQAWETLRQRARDVDVFLPVSHYYAGVMRRRLGLEAEQARVVPVGIDLEGYEPAPEPPAVPTIGYLAQLNRACGLDILAEAFLTVRNRGRVPHVRLRICGAHTPGGRSFVRAIRRRLKDAGADRDVEFLPAPDRATKQEFLRSLSVLSVPAREGVAFGTYIIEAAASGVPVVEPRIGALTELVETTGGGVLVRPEDPDALADAIEGLLARPNEAHALGKRARDVALREFSVHRMAENVVTVCQSIARG